MNCFKSGKFMNNFLHGRELLFNKNVIVRQKFDTVVATFAGLYLLFLAGLLSSPAHFSFLSFQAVLLSAAIFLLPAWCSSSSPSSPLGSPQFSTLWINSSPWQPRRPMTWILRAFLALSLLYTVNTHVYVPAFPASSYPVPQTPSPEIPSSFLWVRNILRGFCV